MTGRRFVAITALDGDVASGISHGMRVTTTVTDTERAHIEQTLMRVPDVPPPFVHRTRDELQFTTEGAQR